VSIGRIGQGGGGRLAYGREGGPMTIRRHRLGHAKLQHYPDTAHLTHI